MRYSVVIATRNRLGDLQQSVPLILKQSIPPAEVIVVDSSDNHGEVADYISGLEFGSVRIDVIKSATGLPYQRNIGVQSSTTDVIFFPDDDALWYPDTAELQLKLYESDREMRISAVGGREVYRSPKSNLQPAHLGRATTYSFRRRLEDKYLQDPVVTIGKQYKTNFSKPANFGDIAVPVEYITGFRMSFRKSVLRKSPFDENLFGYAPFEDIDACLNAWRSGGVVVAPDSRVFHNKSPARRGNGYALGVLHCLNRAYIVAKHSGVDSLARRQLTRYTRYKALLYFLAIRDSHTYSRWLGARGCMNAVARLKSVDSTEAPSLYRKLRSELLK